MLLIFILIAIFSHRHPLNKNMIKFCLFLLTLLLSPVVFANDNYYLYKIATDLADVYSVQKKKDLMYGELKKYTNTHDRKYLISSKYIELILYTENRFKQLGLIYDLLKINNNEFEYIDIVCNYSLSYQYENISPKQAMHFIDKAIIINERAKVRYILPHLYHAKGRFYYNSSDYSNALIYFKKALKLYDSSEVLFKASMYNNFGLVYEKINNFNLAKESTLRGIKILEHKRKLQKNDLDFLHDMKGNLGSYYLKLGNYSESEKYLLDQIDYCKLNGRMHSPILLSIKHLYNLYNVTKNRTKQTYIINYLQEKESDFKNAENKIFLNEILLQHYLAIRDSHNIELTANKLIKLNHQFDKTNSKNIQNISYLLNNHILNKVTDKYNDQIDYQKRKILYSVIIICVICIFFCAFIYVMKKKQKLTLELEMNKKLLLEKNIEFQEEKIKALHINLSLKMEMEKIFMENIKKIKDSREDSEKIAKDLHLKVTNLMQIDKRNSHLMHNFDIEGKLFIDKLTNLFPNLTQKELKLCQYFRVDLSSKEIASLYSTTTGTVRVYKTKIKQKIGLGKEDNLHNFLQNI